MQYPIWTSEDGRQTSVNTMVDEHLVNAHRKVKRQLRTADLTIDSGVASFLKGSKKDDLMGFLSAVSKRYVGHDVDAQVEEIVSTMKQGSHDHNMLKMWESILETEIANRGLAALPL